MSVVSENAGYLVTTYGGTGDLTAAFAKYCEENQFYPQSVQLRLRPDSGDDGLLIVGNKPESGQCPAVWFPDAKCGLDPQDPAAKAAVDLLVACGFPDDERDCLADLLAKYPDMVFITDPVTERLTLTSCRQYSR